MWQMSVFLVCCAFHHLSVGVSSDFGDEDDQPLFLSPYLNTLNISEARRLSRVSPDIANTTSYSGFLTVDEIRESHLFFWFFPAQEDFEKAPMILWVQGGPGMSAMMSLFEEIGPLTYKDDVGVGRRKYSWNVKNNLLFIDQPVGTGYGFSGKNLFAENRGTYSSDLYSALLQFYLLFPELVKNKLIIAGQSFAGHFIPALGLLIHKENPEARVKINLSAMMIGNGWMDALYQSDYGNHLYYLGLVDYEEKEEFDKLFEEFAKKIKDKSWNDALEALFYQRFHISVGNVSLYNFLEPKSSMFEEYENFVQETSTRKAIHVGNATFAFMNDEVRKALDIDVVMSVKPMIEELLEYYPMVFYTGQLDIIAGYPMVSSFLRSLSWSGKEEFNTASRRKWCVGEVQSGYIKSGHNLHDVMVRNAGHVVPKDQPLWAYTLVNSVASSDDKHPLKDLKTCAETPTLL